jgi:hypothetical protein
MNITILQIKPWVEENTFFNKILSHKIQCGFLIFFLFLINILHFERVQCDNSIHVQYMCNDVIRVTDISITSDMYHVLGTFKILSTSHFKILK